MKSVDETISALRGIPDANEASLVGHTFDLVISYIPPVLHLDVVCSIFEGKSNEARTDQLQEWLDNVNLIEFPLSEVRTNLPIAINELTPDERAAKESWSRLATPATWVSSFLTTDTLKAAPLNRAQTFLHFYGYKGGQGRSTVLAFLAKSLADDGFRVLVVDADIEAPSLDLLFGASADSFSQTLMGLCGWSERMSPMGGVYVGKSQGQVDLLPCRPRTPTTDLDFALFTAMAPLDTRIYERGAARLVSQLPVDKDGYDVVMIDHRTGIASSVIPLMRALPGAAIVFARTDFNTAIVPSELQRIVRAIFESTDSVPGAFVSFSLDPQAAAENRSSTESRLREHLLAILADVMEHKAPESNVQLSTTDLSLNWIDWYLDRALFRPKLPDVSDLFGDNIRSLDMLREVLGLPIGRKTEAPLAAELPPDLAAITQETSLSGAKDRGEFIHIPEIEKLFSSGNPYTYILGRKGTGKTRLVKEMSTRRLGTPLLVAQDEDTTPGLRSKSMEADEWLRKCNYDAKTFWWSLLRIGVERPEGVTVGQAVLDHAKTSDPQALARPLEIKSLVARSTDPYLFLVDGLETLVSASKIKTFVAELFNVMATVQNDATLASKLIIRAFVREDLAADTVQNIEQQIEGRYLRLKWDAAAILNFAASRVPSLPWIRSNFTGACHQIAAQWKRIQRGAMSENEVTELLLSIFPARLRRNNLSTATFLRLYFSDAGGDDTNKATFYPRLYLSFLRKLDDLASKAGAPVVNNHLDSALLNQAYDDASREFIEETKQELSHLLELEYANPPASDPGDQTKVSEFIAAFSGLSTPFQHENLVVELRSRTGFNERSIREALQRMKAIRMFEDRPGYAGWWRVGQLYKMGLLMKYVRG